VQQQGRLHRGGWWEGGCGGGPAVKGGMEGRAKVVAEWKRFPLRKRRSTETLQASGKPETRELLQPMLTWAARRSCWNTYGSSPSQVVRAI
jgi:hypothetical protein